MNELTRLADKYGSDKGSLKHNYTDQYYEYLKEFKEKQVVLLEIGVDKGASIEMWLEFFPKAYVVGMDILDCPEGLKKHKRYKHLKCSQIDSGGLVEMPPDYCLHIGCCIVIDDGSHNYADIFYTFGAIEAITDFDLYFVEDLGAKRAGNAMEDLKRMGFKELAPQLAVKDYRG